jgi:DNA-binding transcriptional ArsR family regulator
MTGDTDLAALGSVLGERARARMLLALGDGRALPASVLASEAGVAASTASAHLAQLLDAGLLAVTAQGRHRYYRLAGPQVAELIEVLARVAPTAPVRSLREGTRAQALREARTCYDHLAGRLGVALMQALIGAGAITGGDGRYRVDGNGADRLSAPGRDVDYRLTSAGAQRLARLGVEVPAVGSEGSPLRYCVDWTEQAHHLSGPLGRALARRLLELGWLRRAERGRAVHVTDLGRHGLQSELAVRLAA